jgi:hypothetical protein
LASNPKTNNAPSLLDAISDESLESVASFLEKFGLPLSLGHKALLHVQIYADSGLQNIEEAIICGRHDFSDSLPEDMQMNSANEVIDGCS